MKIDKIGGRKTTEEAVVGTYTGCADSLENSNGKREREK